MTSLVLCVLSILFSREQLVEVVTTVLERLSENTCFFFLCQIIHTIDECTDIVYTVTAPAVRGMVSPRCVVMEICAVLCFAC